MKPNEIGSADEPLNWRYADGGQTGQQWAVRKCKLIPALELWTRESEDDAGTCIILPWNHAKFLSNALAKVANEIAVRR